MNADQRCGARQVGEFQCYDRRALASLAQAAQEAGHPEWGYSGPHDAGTYNSTPEVRRARVLSAKPCAHWHPMVVITREGLCSPGPCLGHTTPRAKCGVRQSLKDSPCLVLSLSCGRRDNYTWVCLLQRQQERAACVVQETPFFRGWGGSWDTPYGRFFLSWYSGALLAHGERLVAAATSVFTTAAAPRCTLATHSAPERSIGDCAYGIPGLLPSPAPAADPGAPGSPTSSEASGGALQQALNPDTGGPAAEDALAARGGGFPGFSVVGRTLSNMSAMSTSTSASAADGDEVRIALSGASLGLAHIGQVQIGGHCDPCTSGWS